METLCQVMTLNGWSRIALLLSDYFPAWVVIPSLVLYIMLCTLAVFGIVTGTICESFATTARQVEHDRERALEAHRFKLERALRDKLETCGKVKEGYLTRTEWERVVYYEWYLMYDLQVLDPAVNTEILMELFDQLTRDNPETRDFVKYDCLAEAVANRHCDATAFDMIDFKHECRLARKEWADGKRALNYDITERYQQAIDIKKTVQKEQRNLSDSIKILQKDCDILSKEFSDLGVQMNEMDKQSDTVRKERKLVFDTICSNVGQMTTDVNTALDEQTTQFGEQVATVQTQASTATATLGGMQEKVGDLPNQIDDAMCKLGGQVALVAKRTRGYAEKLGIENQVDLPDDGELDEMIAAAAAKQEMQAHVKDPWEISSGSENGGDTY